MTSQMNSLIRHAAGVTEPSRRWVRTPSTTTSASTSHLTPTKGNATGRVPIDFRADRRQDSPRRRDQRVAWGEIGTRDG